MLPMKAVKKFIRREEEQGTKLEEAHRRRYNRSLRQTQMLPNKDGKLELVQVIYPSHFVREMRRLGLRAAQAPRLAPHNSCARIWWFRTLGGHVCEHLGATGPSWATKDRVWFVTLVDKRMAFDPDAWVEVAHDYNLQPQAKPEPIELRRNYLPLLEDLNYVAMIEPTLYVSTRRVHGRKTTILYHVHALVWGIEEPELKKHCEMVRDEIQALLPYATSADYRQVNEGDLLQMLWYVSKAPRKQYQLHRRPETGTLKQFKRDINGVNSVL